MSKSPKQQTAPAEAKKPDPAPPAAVAPEAAPDAAASSEPTLAPEPTLAEGPPEAEGTLESMRSTVAELDRVEDELDDIGELPDPSSPDYQPAINKTVDHMVASMTDVERAAFRIAVARTLGLVDPEVAARAASAAALVNDGAFEPEAEFYEVVQAGAFASDGSIHHLTVGSIVGRATHPLDNIRASKDIVLRPKV